MNGKVENVMHAYERLCISLLKIDALKLLIFLSFSGPLRVRPVGRDRLHRLVRPSQVMAVLPAASVSPGRALPGAHGADRHDDLRLRHHCHEL